MTTPSALATRAIALDTETFSFARALMAPPPVCLQWADVTGEHAVEPTRRIRDAAHWALSEHDQIWLHNGPFDLAVLLAWYPELSPLVWAAYDRGAILDTMYLQRLIQIARGDIGGPLGLDPVSQLWGLPAVAKDLTGTHETYPGVTFDVRTSFGLFYGAEVIPNPWHDYADYDGIATLKLAGRQVAKYATPTTPGRVPPVRLEDLAMVCRTYFGLNLARIYGLRVDPTNTAKLANAAHAAIARLREGAIINGFLQPVAAKRADKLAGRAAALRFCNKPKHANCPGCMVQGLDDAGLPSWKLDTKTLGAAVAAAYEGKPPLTEPKVDKKTGKRTGGGSIARSRDVLQDSGNEELTAFSEFNEWSKVVNTDLVMFQSSPIHAGIGVTNNLRPSSFGPNVLNLRRDGFLVATCPTCDYEMTVDPKEYKSGTVLLCPCCEVETNE